MATLLPERLLAYQNSMPRPSPQEHKLSVLSENITKLTLGLFRLHEAVRRLNDHVDARYADSGDDSPLEALADVNRTHAHVEQLANEAHFYVTAQWTACPRYHGDGIITQPCAWVPCGR